MEFYVQHIKELLLNAQLPVSRVRLTVDVPEAEFDRALSPSEQTSANNILARYNKATYKDWIANKKNEVKKKDVAESKYPPSFLLDVIKLSHNNPAAKWEDIIKAAKESL